jgi:xanthine dehydrogenase accessory factor
LSEALFAALAARLPQGPLVLASVLATRGASPRKAGARMLIGPDFTEFSIGGGLAEARVIAAARALLHGQGTAQLLSIDLSGGVDSAGVCGGQMQLALRRWTAADAQRADTLAATLTGGGPVALGPADIGGGDGLYPVAPNARLLIVGGGHCGAALYQLAQHLDFDLWMYDPRPQYASASAFPQAHVLSGDFSALRAALDTRRALYGVLLNRDFGSDVQTLRELAGREFAFLGMMGSRKRIAIVRAALSPEQARALTGLQAPIGLDIDAQTPHEIAISILAHLIQARAAAALCG